MKLPTSLAVLMLGSTIALGAAAAQQALPAYSAAQAEQGAALYKEKCTVCHGAELASGQFAPSLKGARFRKAWGGKPAADLFSYIAQNMPPGQAASLSPEEHAAVLAYILQGNGVPAGTSALPAKPEAISGVLPQ